MGGALVVALSSDKDKKNWRRFDATSERKELTLNLTEIAFLLKAFVAFGVI